MSTNDTPRRDALTSADTCIAGHARTLERELAAAQAKIANQSDRLRYLEGATNHATGTPLSQAHAKIAELEQDKARLDWLEDDQNRTLLAFTIRASQTYREGIDAARKEGQP
jgi:hypothetical protein